MKGIYGAYGFAISGIDEAEDRLVPALHDWPRLRIEYSSAKPASVEPAGTMAVSEEAATLWLPDGDRIELARGDEAVRILMATPPSPELILHPLLGLPAAILSAWRGRLSLHGGAFSCDGKAWAILGDRGTGKSTSLGQLHALGQTIISDDMLIISERTVFSGPRTIDLRSEPAKVLGGDAMGVLGARERWRLHPGPAPPSIPLAGFVALAWGDAVSIDPLPTEERLEILYRSSAIYPRPSEAAALLELLVLPAWRFTRPRNLEFSAPALTQLVRFLEV